LVVSFDLDFALVKVYVFGDVCASSSAPRRCLVMEWGVASICGRLAASCERDRRASVSVFAKATLGAISFLGRIGISLSSGGRVWLVHLTLGLAAAAVDALALFSYFC
jgi:hypothetical protein